ncbi:uncharacterized protein C10orf67 homolog, mitochondrial [Bombina bombina]|uniref:uncharacterized protein C10orf67 homolog, mitochondrial n=1 Tax=Bombina bombina TaxID=8345 RepID=UPI00235B05D0|nr:uncharacterized protein C10orf67 homolog, mitochondrial [Bombina bombina]
MEQMGIPENFGSQDKVLDLEIWVKEVLEQRPSISDQLRVGLYTADHASQTDQSEICAIQEMTKEIQTLVKSFDSLKKDVAVRKQNLQADYDHKIEAQALKLYKRINDAVQDIEEVHKKKISVLRSSFQQQLIDALAVITVYYQNYYARSKTHCAYEAYGDNRQILGILDEKDKIIKSLEAQILELEEKEHPKEIIFVTEDDPEKERLQEENKELKGGIDALQEKVFQLEELINQKDKHIHSLDLDVGAMKTKMEKDQKTIEKLVSDQEKLKMELENEKSASVALLQKQKEEFETTIKTTMQEKESELQKQKEEWEKAFTIKIQTKEREQALLQQAHEAQIREEADKQKELLVTEREKLKRELKQMHQQQIKAVTMETSSTDKDKLFAQITMLLAHKEENENTIKRLQKELDRTNKTWEKKFDILKQSFHAIKDEMFLRQSLQRQTLNLHKVSVSYMQTNGGTPFGPTPKNSICFSSVPLPNIGARSPSPVPMTQFFEGYMGGHEQNTFPGHELEVVSDTEGDLEDVPCLPPPPPNRNKEKEAISI